MITDIARRARRRRVCTSSLAALCVLVATGLGYGWFGPAQTMDEARYWQPVQSLEVEHAMGLVGRIEPSAAVTFTAPFDGDLLEYAFEPGQRVEKGQRLALMDTQWLEGQLRDALAVQLKARSQFERLRDWRSGHSVLRAQRLVRASQLALDTSLGKLRESQALYDQGIVARVELEDLQQQTQMQRLEVTAATEELAQVVELGRPDLLRIAEMELQNATIRHDRLQSMLEGKAIVAPFDGTIVPVPSGPSTSDSLSAPLQAGSRVNRGQALLTVANTERLKVVAQVSELDVNRLQVGQPVQVSGDGFESRLAGEVEWISRLALPHDEAGASAWFPLAILVDVSPEELLEVRLGMSARLNIVTGRSEAATVVPLEAVRSVGTTSLLKHRVSLQAPVTAIAITTGQTTPAGIEVFGLPPGWIRSVF